jgi:hypothetical protein
VSTFNYREIYHIVFPNITNALWLKLSSKILDQLLDQLAFGWKVFRCDNFEEVCVETSQPLPGFGDAPGHDRMLN